MKYRIRNHRHGFSRAGGSAPRRVRRFPFANVSGLAMSGALLAAAAVVSFVPAEPALQQAGSVHFSICGTGNRTSCVIDGDTIWLDGRKIRLADIDTPEIFSPRCSGEEALGQRAKTRLHQLLNQGPIVVRTAGPREFDRYGRDLRIIERDGRSVGMTLVSEGLARPWTGRRRGWC